MQYIKFSHQVVGATWSEKENGWHVTVENLSDGTIFDAFCDVLLNCNGILK